jgi:hypothetical protein
LSVVERLPVEAFSAALTPIDGQIDTIGSAQEVLGAFVHAVILTRLPRWRGYEQSRPSHPRTENEPSLISSPPPIHRLLRDV